MERPTFPGEQSVEGRILRLLAVLAALALFAPSSSPQEPNKLIFAVGSTSFVSSHASTIVELKNGDLLAAWFGGSGEGNPDVAIWSSRRTGSSWSKPVELAREPGVPCWNPALFHTHDGRLWLYYKVGPNPMEWTGARKYSNDEGVTWSTAEYLPAGMLGPVRAKPLVLDNGVVVAGTSVEAYRTWSIWIERSSDNGRTWSKIGPIPLAPGIVASTGTVTHGLIQPSVVDLGGKHLRLYARSTSDIARVCIADSFDNGLTWTNARPLDVPNPNSGIDVVGLRDGRVVLVYNDSTSQRWPLKLAVSRDGEHFQDFRTLEADRGEFSYPAIIQNAGGDLEITYTWNRKSIAYVHLPLSEIPK
jgi:predicted neuraminidase